MSSDELVKILRSISDSFYTEPLWAKIEPLLGFIVLGVMVYFYIRMTLWEQNTIKKLYKIYDKD